MKKQLLISLIAIAVLIATLLIINPKITGNTIDLSEHSYTRAICNSTNYCQDYEINCNDEKVIKINPITGASVQHSPNWQDPREERNIENLCKP
ncbi:MAG: hypothetical protein ABIF18_00620 [archaeon]